MAEVERRVYFYGVEMHDGEWRRAEVLRGLQALQGDDQVLALGNDNYAWALVDRVPTPRVERVEDDVLVVSIDRLMSAVRSAAGAVLPPVRSGR